MFGVPSMRNNLLISFNVTVEIPHSIKALLKVVVPIESFDFHQFGGLVTLYHIFLDLAFFKPKLYLLSLFCPKLHS